jgi:hypothetical protein
MIFKSLNKSISHGEKSVRFIIRGYSQRTSFERGGGIKNFEVCMREEKPLNDIFS